MDWNAVLITPVQALVSQLLVFIPSFLGALLILGIGWFVAKIFERVVVEILKTLQLDRLAERIQLADIFAKGGIKQRFSELVGAISYWLIMLVVLVATLNALQLTTAAQLLEQVFAFLPNVVAAIFILVVGMFAATFLATTVRTAASNSRISQAQLLGQAVQAIMVVFTIVAALKQLRIEFVGEAFLIILAASCFGLALAFGLGCKDLAGRWVSGLIDQLSSRKR